MVVAAWLMACSGGGSLDTVGGGPVGGGGTSELAGGAIAEVGAPVQQANAVPGASSGEVSTRFDPTGQVRFRAEGFQAKLCESGESIKFLASGVLIPLPGVSDPICNSRVLRAVDVKRHLYTEIKLPDSGECRFEISLSAVSGVAAQWQFYVGDSSVTLSAEGSELSFDPSNLLVIAQFSPVGGEAMAIYNPDISYLAFDECPVPAAGTFVPSSLQYQPRPRYNFPLPDDPNDGPLLEVK
ncbi:MAG TPA: hypothetical protein VJP40_05330 [bacterium]|nr:hypothetical protein [bacterium]